MNTKILNDIISYKKSAAIIAVLKMNLLSEIYEKKFIDLSICVEKGWNPDYFLLLVEYLSEIGYLKSYNKEKWSLNSELEKEINQLNGIQNLIEHENSIFGKWISPEIIIQAIESNSGKRRFDLIGFNEKEDELYRQAIYGKSYIFVGYYFLRNLTPKKAAIVAEFGRRNDIYKDFLQKKLPPDSRYNSISSINELAGMYDGIIMTNIIHYYTAEKLLNVVQTIREHLIGILCISDLFVNENNDFNKSLYIDWITHGGVYNLSLDSVLKILEQAGYNRVKHTYLDIIQTHIIVAYK